MGIYSAVARFGIRGIALIGIVPGAVVAVSYLLVLTGQLYHQWDARIAVVIGMGAWGVLGVVELWHEYVRLSRTRVDGEPTPVSPRAILFVWALLLFAFAGWKGDTHPWMAAFLAFVALYSLCRAFGLLRYVARSPAVSGHARVPRALSGAPARAVERSRGRRSPAPMRRRASN